MSLVSEFTAPLEVGVGAIGSAAGVNRRKEGRGTKRGRDEDDFTKKPDMKLNVPEILKVLLVDDWEAITKNNQVGIASIVVKLDTDTSLAGHTSESSDSD